MQASKRRLLLISNSTQHGSGYLEHCAPAIKEFLSVSKVSKVLFVPWALKDCDGYAAKASGAFSNLMGLQLQSIHLQQNPKAAVENAEAIFIGGGNTFRLLNQLYHHDLVTAIRRKVLEEGTPYIGTSNVACITIKTTNDMPIVYPPSFDALGLVPFNLNPHYMDPDPTSTHKGETREERIREFHEENDPPVVGLREGTMLHVEGNKMTLRGPFAARIFQKGKTPTEHPPDEQDAAEDLSFLLV